MTATPWTNRHALVTGAASGIGLALSRALVHKGAIVHMADVDAAGLGRAAAEFSDRVRTAVVDVRDAVAVRDLVDEVVREAGRLDYLFNNAGIGIAGEAHEIAVEHYDRIIDVNIRGVVNGVAAAYPVMVKQGSGHIVTTASLEGVSPAPLLVPYAMTKHAVVGLTTSLRLEAQRYGVRVSAFCPAAVETPLLDADTPADLPPLTSRPNVRQYLEKAAGAAYPADRLAEYVLRGVARNRMLIIAPARARLIALLYRLLPALVMRESGRTLEAQRARRPGHATVPSGST